MSDQDAEIRGYAAGWRAALEHVATGHAELDRSWKPIGRIAEAQLIAERVALFEQCARDINQRLGRPADYRYDGGPVDWDTGTPLRQAKEPS